MIHIVKVSIEVARGSGRTAHRNGDLSGGCYAEYVAAPAKKVARKPASLSFEEAQNCSG